MNAATLGLPLRRAHREHPFWHRPAPAVAVVRLDPGFAGLRSGLPGAWEAIVRVKYLLDALTAIAHTPRGAGAEFSGHPSQDRCRPLWLELVRGLEEVARRAPGGLLRRQAGEAGERVAAYLGTGQWSSLELEAPRPGELWMYCGPLRPWAMQDSPQPLALLVGQPQPAGQWVIDRVSQHRPLLQGAVEEALGQAVSPADAVPEMFAVDLLLAGGTADSGHKNFAHFFPMEAPAARVSHTDFTVVFSNVHAERLARCSLRLLAVASGTSVASHLGDVARASFAWFRCHDLAHFWTPPGHEAGAFAPFEEMVLKEALADTLGLLSLAALEDASAGLRDCGGESALGAAFSSEMLRYLSRNHHEFADTAAAALEAGWLAQTADVPWDEPQYWLEAALPPFASLARAVHAALGGSPAPVPALRRALHEGRAQIARWYGPLAGIPTDLEYSVG